MEKFAFIIGIVFVLLLVEVLVFLPQQMAKKPKKKPVKKPLQPVVVDDSQKKDWEEKQKKHQRQVSALNKNILDLEKIITVKEKEVLVERAKAKKFQEKLGKERSWQEKEKEEVNKITEECKLLKSELNKAQQQYSDEHALNIRLTKEVDSFKRDMESLNDKRRAAEAQAAQLKSQNDEYRKQILHLKKDVAELTKKEEDMNWIAKTEYDRIYSALQKKEKDLDRLKREMKG